VLLRCRRCTSWLGRGQVGLIVLILLTVSTYATGQQVDAAAPQEEVRKSRKGNCHDSTSRDYARLRSYESFKTMKDCVASGGRSIAKASHGPNAADDGTKSREAEPTFIRRARDTFIRWIREWWSVWMAPGIGFVVLAVFLWPGLRRRHARYKTRRAHRLFEARARKHWQGYKRNGRSWRAKMGMRSPIKSKPLRNPGQSLDEEIERTIHDDALEYLLIPGVFVFLAAFEWYATAMSLPRQPVLYTIAALVLIAFGGYRVLLLRRRVRDLKLGRDGERVVGQFLEGLRVNGARVFHDIPGDEFNLDHVVICDRGVFVVETKTRMKARSMARVTQDGDSIRVDGYKPDRDPVVQIRAACAWLKRELEASTGKRIVIRGVIVFPGWFVETRRRPERNDFWVLEPKALPAYIENEPERLSPDDVALLAYHLSRYVRTSY
jgi:Nuclease-related domain